MASKDNTYSNRQIKGTENLFAPDDLDALLVGGVNQPSFESGADIVINNAADGVAAIIDDEDNSNDGLDEEEDIAEDEESEDGPDDRNEPPEPEKIGTVTKVIFSQINKFTPNGTFLADVVLEIEEVEGATDYEINYFKIS